MNIGINLASEPFERHRPLVVASVAVGVMLVALLAFLVTLSVQERSALADTRAAIEQSEKELADIARQQAKYDTILRRPENAEVLERSLFLNSLLYRKAISWTEIFADLEKTLPYNTRVLTIRPWLSNDHKVVLEMTVGAEQTAPLLKLLINMESSELFGATAVSNRLPPSQNEPLYRYKVNVNYAQKY